jgi:AmmeMemoRadiSam system protein A
LTVAGTGTQGDAPGGGLGPADFARACLEAMVRRQRPPEPPEGGFYGRRAACFVSLKRRGELRGCIGTLTPAEPDLGHEIVRNTASAAFSDPRFPPVTADEVDALSCSLDVLSASELATLEELDPRRYGVIVSAGARRGVLLPDLPGIDAVGQQVEIALQKAGISPDETYVTERFTVERYAEGDAAPA